MDFLILDLTSRPPEVGLYTNEYAAQGACMVHLINDPREVYPDEIDESEEVAPDLVVYRIDLKSLEVELDSKYSIRVAG